MGQSFAWSTFSPSCRMASRVNMVQFEFVRTTSFLLWASVSGRNHSSKMSRLAGLLSLAAVSGLLTLLAAFWLGRPDVHAKKTLPAVFDLMHSKSFKTWHIPIIPELYNLQASKVDLSRVGILATESCWAAEQPRTLHVLTGHLQVQFYCKSWADGTTGDIRTCEKSFGKRLFWKAVQTCSDRFPARCWTFSKDGSVGSVVQGSQALLAYHWARQASLSWFQTVWTTMVLNWFQDRREKSMKLYIAISIHTRICQDQTSSVIFSLYFQMFGGPSALPQTFNVSQAQIKANAVHSILTPILLYDIGAAMDATARHPSHSVASVTWHFQTSFFFFFQIVTCVQQKQYEARVFQNGCVWKWVLHGSAVYPQMAIGIGKMMINGRFMGYPIFRQTQTAQTESDWLLHVAAILAASQFALTQKLLVYEAMVKLYGLHLYEFVGVKKGVYPMVRW